MRKFLLLLTAAFFAFAGFLHFVRPEPFVKIVPPFIPHPLAAVYLSGDFEAQYRKFVDGIVAPNKQAKVTSTTEVTGVAVESLDDPNAVVIVYTNTTSTSPLKKNIPSLKYLSYRIFMKRSGGRWLVTRMNTITSLDLTPQI